MAVHEPQDKAGPDTFAQDDYPGDHTLAPRPECQEEPLPPAPVWAPPDPKAFHGLLGDIVRVIEPETEADPVAVIAQLLVGFGNVIGRNAHFKVGGDRHHLNLYTILIGDTAMGGKGMSWGRARSVLAETDREWADNNVTGGVASGEGLIFAIRDDQPNNEGVEDKRLLVTEPEWGRVMTVAAKDGSIVSHILRSFWDTGNARSMRSDKKGYRCTNGHVSIIGHVTETELRSKMHEAEKTNGGANRVLWLYVRRTKSLPFGGDPWPAALNKLVEELKFAVNAATLLTEPMGLTQQAMEAWPPLYTRLTAPTPGTAGAMLARGAPIVRRLAAVYALADAQVDVRLADLEAAMALWDYSTRSVIRVFGSSTGSADADRILAALAAAPKGLTRTEISIQVFKRNITSARIVAALTLLRDNRWAHAERKTTARTTVERWFAGPPPTN